uniref:Endonuclease/exonuclease/phosphatase domain-containing protein n=1 Tax=Sinocyclocheilus grahami TaxID=75366 RepID=A0A672LJX4_SINGR
MDLNVMSWNVNGLNGVIKRTKCLDYLRSKRISFALIQESHLKACDIHRFQNRYYQLVYFSSSDKKSKGVLILMARHLPFSIHCSRSDADGRITYILGTWSNIKCAFVSV